MPLTDEQRRRNEASIRAAMDRLLRGELPPQWPLRPQNTRTRGRSRQNGLLPATRPQGNQRPGPYQHLAEEFHRRIDALRQAGTIPDPRELQIVRLKDENATLRERIQARDAEIDELSAFKDRALSQLAAQHQEILRLRQSADSPDNVRKLPAGSR
jgi:hypothetical protein